MRRLVMATALAAALLPLLAAPAAAHPLGNYTVNRAVAVLVGPTTIDVSYVLDMAEIPAFSEIEAIAGDADGVPSGAEAQAYADASCRRIERQVTVTLDGVTRTLETGSAPTIAFPEGAADLRTLRLECHFAVDGPDGATSALAVSDSTEDGHVGWREVTIAAAPGVRLSGSDVPARSASANLTSYPTDQLQSPPDVRQGHATVERRAGAAGSAGGGSAAPAGGPRIADPLTALVGGTLSPAAVIIALLVAAGLGVGHALSPGHGKTLVAAYLVGGRGSARQAVVLGLTVAATHTAGVLVLGVVVLLAGELLLPEVVIGWLTVVSGGLMAVLGAGLLWRAAASRRGGGVQHHDHPHPHPHPHAHPHGHPHAPRPTTLSVRGVALLGVAGGLVPSASAVIVLLAAVTTGRLVFGLALIVAFGMGMAAVLAGLAVASAVARGWLDRPTITGHGLVRRGVALLPIGSGLLVMGIGLVIAISAAASLG